MSKYAEFSELVERVTRLMQEKRSVHYTLGYIMQCYISLAFRTNKLDTEIQHMQLIEKELQLKTKESA